MKWQSIEKAIIKWCRRSSTGLTGVEEHRSAHYLAHIVPVKFNGHFWPSLPFCSPSSDVSDRWRISFTDTEINLNPLLQYCCPCYSTPMNSSHLSSSPVTGPGHEPSLWGPQLWVHIQGFSFPFSGQLRASRLAHANMLPLTQPQLPESHPGWLFPGWRHSIHGFRLLTASDWYHCSHLQHQHWWVSKPESINRFAANTLMWLHNPCKIRKWKLSHHIVVLHVAKLNLN